MGEWNKKQRFAALLSGERADRPIVSGWRHILDKEQNAKDLAEATVAFTKQFDWDWVKINPRATYYAESWGNTYDFQDYRSVFPKQTRAVIQKASDVWDIHEKKAIESTPLKEQLEAVKQIRQGLPDTPLVQTIFSPLTVLLFLAGQSAYVNDTVYGSENPVTIAALLSEQRTGVHRALHAIAMTLADYVIELNRAGADGIFYAVTGTANPDMFEAAAFNEFSRPYDLIVLEAAQQGKRILHTCGAHAQPERFSDYPIDGISWDTKAAGNPDLDAALNATKIGGVDHALFAANDIGRIHAQAEEALSIMANQPFILAPNCSIPVNVTDEALIQLRQSVLEKETME
ncbi:uroporphyrinogen decarboxylase family protein [Bacillus canaveralius]|uniref:uroporphyrinogen decarboxylase family protein n=1 Tax=Bacillus canaveralius TaxID=1403243 RepID=UPI000F766F11|nr:uroporphyrinogen decarboxylase family protein [Bacillus canaveralius]RSK54634.1 uroporphyrinogen-III decarboxylase [Bacillus canaveralius]